MTDVSRFWPLGLLCLGAACSDREPAPASPALQSTQGNAVLFADATGDGLVDRLVGAPAASSDALPRAGAVFVHAGLAEGGFAVERTILWSPQARARFGDKLFSLGDLDGGGKPDVAIAAPLADGETPDSGVVYVVRGEAPDAPVALGGRESGEVFGRAVAAGDLDGDGRRDLVVGAYRSSAGIYQGGEVRYWLGGIGDGSAAPSGTIVATDLRRALGNTLLVMDLTGDGIDDLVAAGEGEVVYVFYGKAGFAPSYDAPDVRLYSWPAAFDPTGKAHLASGFGDALADLGDLDGDGIHELGITNASRSQFDLYDRKGALYVFRGGAALPAAIHVDSVDGDGKPYRLATVIGYRNLDRFGEALVPVGDVDGGGKPDVLVGAPWANATVPTGGAVYLLTGEALATTASAGAATRIFGGQQPGGRFGDAVAWDATSRKVLVGAPDRDLYTGRAFVLDVDHDGGEGAGVDEEEGDHDHHH